ncbi:MAG: chemotaxis protein CheV [Gammaproteobacteria bacterium]|nr:chemotaxis protein CheV [Gammaproteobacteria bacterium]
MASIMDSVNQRTQLVGQNRLELLLFRLAGAQLYGINVFKVREVLPCPQLTALPHANPVVRGVASVRGMTVSIIDLALATGRLEKTSLENSFVIITEYNNGVQGFLVGGVERIVNLNWSEVLPPPPGSGHDHYLTAVTRVDEQLVEIIDVEKVFAQVVPSDTGVSEGVIDEQVRSGAVGHKIMVVDDSSVARKQLRRVLEDIGVELVVLNDGRAAYNHLHGMLAEGIKPSEEFAMLISDIEMPEMDGYTLTAEVRANPELKDLYVMLHTSLSGVFNQAMVEKVGANEFLAKFKPDELAEKVINRLRSLRS